MFALVFTAQWASLRSQVSGFVRRTYFHGRCSVNRPKAGSAPLY